MRLRLVLAVASPIVVWLGAGAAHAGPAAARADAVRPCPSGATRRGSPPPNGLSVWCEQDGVHHGPYTMWYPSGQVMRRGFTDRGALQGKQLSWYANGQLADRVYYRAGVPAGRWTHWYRDGTVASKREFRSGKPHGLVKRWRRDGSLAYSARYRWGTLIWEKEYAIPKPPPRAPDPQLQAKRDCRTIAQWYARPMSLDALEAEYRRCLRAAGR